MSNKELWEGFVSAAQRRAVWASKADGGKGHPDNKKKKSKKEDVNEISKDMAGRYLKKVPASAADAGRKTTGSMGIGQDDQKKNMKKGINQFVNRNKGTSMAVDKMTGKAKVPATESVNKMGNPKEDSDAVKAFLAKGGKIKKLPPAKAQGYHGKDDPGKDVHGVMDKPDTKAIGTRKKVRSMENKVNEDPEMAKMIAKNNAAQQAKRDAANPDAAKKRKAAQDAIAKKKPVTPDSIGRHSSQGGGFVGTRESTLKTFDDLRNQLSEALAERASYENL